MSTCVIKNYHQTTPEETVLPVTYIERYSDPVVRQAVHNYKFGGQSPYNPSLEKGLRALLVDMCVDQVCDLKHLRSDKESDKETNSQAVVFTCPPSTMYERREKPEDSMWSLLKTTSLEIKFFVQDEVLCWVRYRKVFSVSRGFLSGRKAQHLGGGRQSRISDTDKRYSISPLFKLQVLYLIHIKKMRLFSFYIVDDVASTGGTLLACKQTLELYFSELQMKIPRVSFDIQVFSLTH